MRLCSYHCSAYTLDMGNGLVGVMQPEISDPDLTAQAVSYACPLELWSTG